MTLIRKIVSLLIDYMVLVLCTIVIVNYIVPIPVGIWAGIQEYKGLVVSSDLMRDKIGIVSVCSMLIVSFFYYSHFRKKTGQTIGEKIMKIKIVPANGERISLLAGIIRTLFLAPILAIIGFIPVSTKPYKPLLDHICSTKTEPIRHNR